MLIWGHRGAYDRMPENTVCGFMEAARLGADGVEFDVQLTKDGAVVVAHDETIDRVSDGSGYIKDYTLSELKRFNFNKRGESKPLFMEIPTLDETLRALSETALEINIELKTGIIYYGGIEQKTVDTVKRYGLSERVVYSSFNHYSVQKVKEYEKTARTALLCGGGILITGGQCGKTGAEALHINVRQARYPGLFEDCRRHGVKIRIWTVEDDGDFAYAMANGADGVFVNNLMKYARRAP